MSTDILDFPTIDLSDNKDIENADSYEPLVTETNQEIKKLWAEEKWSDLISFLETTEGRFRELAESLEHKGEVDAHEVFMIDFLIDDYVSYAKEICRGVRTRSMIIAKWSHRN